MRRRLMIQFSAVSLVIGVPVCLIGAAQQVPKKDKEGNPVSIILNSSQARITIEYRSNGEWQSIVLVPNQDTKITGEHVRVSTTRNDKAVVTVDLPIEAGKKYRLTWNSQANIWDFSPAE
jgi:hypothetical protein